MKNKAYLLDTHIFIWLMEKSPRINENLFTLLKNPEVKIFLSIASIWEIAIKRSRKPIRVPKDLMRGIKATNFLILPIDAQHVLGIENLPFHHKDPFDRILVSQAKKENLTLITSDKKIWKYNVDLLKV